MREQGDLFTRRDAVNAIDPLALESPFGELTFRVDGMPGPQGSKKHVGHGIMVESSKAVKPWREAVKYAALEERRRPGRPAHEMITGPAEVFVTFFLPRPKGHYGTGRNAGVVKASAPARPATRPDIDKLVRSTLDALKEAGVYKDDGQIVTLSASKNFAETGVNSGAVITVGRV